jgi:NDP-sugar pyrophosphorylase family protein
MAPVAGVPFLDFIIAYLLRSGIRDIVLCTGYRSDVIEKYYRRGIAGVKVVISREEKPLGTAGALKRAEACITSDPFFVLNGDSICAADLSRLLRSHLKKKALASIVLTKSTGRRDAGSVLTDRSGRVIKFSEKSGNGRSAFLNAGIYLLDKKVLALIPKSRKYSLEYDLFPGLKGCYGSKSRAALLDIGVPERYKLAGKILKKAKGLA